MTITYLNGENRQVTEHLPCRTALAAVELLKAAGKNFKYLVRCEPDAPAVKPKTENQPK
jgi:hypothetical protein